MQQHATPIQSQPAPTLDGLYRLIRGDLAKVDALILQLVKNEVPLIYDIAKYIIASGGKRIRPALTLIAAQACQAKGENHITLAAAVEFLHTATLLHDDVVDESKMRRGLATANEVFGNKASVLVGDFLISQAFQLMVKVESLDVFAILSEASAIIAKGEVMQLMSEGEPETSVEHYLQVISSKTAALFAAACELGAVAANDEAQRVPLHEFGMHIGTAFQLVDDVLDYAAEQKTLGKNLGDDFAEGKITLPVIIAYANGNAEEKQFWQRTLAERKQTPGDFDTALTLLKKHNALAQTLAMAGSYCQKARMTLSSLPASAAKTAMLDIVDFCATRAY